jgi:tetratricopeptide (TPR) repeat protein
MIEEMIEQGLNHAALAHLDALEPKAREAPRAIYLRAEVQRRGGDLSGAQQTYTRLLDTCLGGLGHFGLGRIAMTRCGFDEARHELERARALRPVDARVLNDLGMVYFARGDLDAARDSFQTAVELTRGKGPAPYNLVHVLLLQQRDQEAIDVARHFGVRQAKLLELQEQGAPDLGCGQAAGAHAVAPDAAAAVPAAQGDAAAPAIDAE